LFAVGKPGAARPPLDISITASACITRIAIAIAGRCLLVVGGLARVGISILRIGRARAGCGLLVVGARSSCGLLIVRRIAIRIIATRIALIAAAIPVPTSVLVRVSISRGGSLARCGIGVDGSGDEC
jgi:hypothetical protein